jgi:hypothetical protein
VRVVVAEQQLQAMGKEGSTMSRTGERSRGDACFEEEEAGEMVACGVKGRVEGIRHEKHSHVGEPEGLIERRAKRTMGS